MTYDPFGPFGASVSIYHDLSLPHNPSWFSHLYAKIHVYCILYNYIYIYKRFAYCTYIHISIAIVFLFTKLLISFRVSPYCGWCLDPSPKHRSTLNYGFWPGITACAPDFSRLCTVFVQCILCHETLQVSRK